MSDEFTWDKEVKPPEEAPKPKRRRRRRKLKEIGEITVQASYDPVVVEQIAQAALNQPLTIFVHSTGKRSATGQPGEETVTEMTGFLSSFSPGEATPDEGPSAEIIVTPTSPPPP